MHTNTSELTIDLPIVQKDVAVISCTFDELVNASNCTIPNSDIQGQLSVPEYQRPYVWKERQINRLLDDLNEYHLNDDEDKPLFYLGSIILHQDGNQLKIIDGQQRITTLLLMYSIVHPAFNSGIEYSAPSTVERIRKNFSYLKSVHEGEVFDYAGKDILNIIDLRKINVTLVITATEDLAYTFFETQNTGGVRLSGSDIIKAHHLRAVDSRKMINYQARRWESIANTKVESVIQNLTKIRFWDNRNWRRFPFYRDKNGIKEVLITEFTEHTNHDHQDISFYYSAVNNVDGRAFIMHESHYKQLKQPLSDGNNTLDYINEYIQLYDILFVHGKNDHRVSNSFYRFSEKLLHQNQGSVYLKELLEICIVAYVSRFGFYRLFEASLWLFRVIYSLRVISDRNVREDSVFKFVFDHKIIDNILEVYTVDELFQNLRRFKYQFNTKNAVPNKSKDRHLNILKNYFEEFTKLNIEEITPKGFDQVLIDAITKKITNKNSDD